MQHLRDSSRLHQPRIALRLLVHFPILHPLLRRNLGYARKHRCPCHRRDEVICEEIGIGQSGGAGRPALRLGRHFREMGVVGGSLRSNE